MAWKLGHAQKCGSVKKTNKQEFRINKIIMLLKKTPKNYHIELYVVHVLINSRNQIHSFR